MLNKNERQLRPLNACILNSGISVSWQCSVYFIQEFALCLIYTPGYEEMLIKWWIFLAFWNINLEFKFNRIPGALLDLPLGLKTVTFFLKTMMSEKVTCQQGQVGMDILVERERASMGMDLTSL